MIYPTILRRAFSIGFISLLLYIFTFAALAQAATLQEIRDRGVIRIAIAGEEPYGYLNKEGKALGVGPEVATRILKSLGIERIEWVQTDFKNLIPGLEVGRFDMAAAEMAIMPHRCRRVLFSNPNTSYGEGLLVLAANPNRIIAYEDFIERPDNIKVAVQEGTTTQAMFKAMGIAPDRLLIVQSLKEAVDAITRGRVDAFAGTGMTVAKMEDMSPAVEAEFNFVDPIIDGEEVRYWGGFAFPHDARELRDAVNGELRELKNYGDWKQVLSRYGFLMKDIIYSYRFNSEQLCQEKG
ncbi:ectoine/hydroxyectoine ABC transporter substrate-binding protein EhuB [Vreelandella massiliensis]|uniref:ectoine/hydroxyectoine ABC transporter substrate-binding protein EhuB n=1 Tax=Vreelandella massiliensis TaxID=1816686 RepID=UPI00096A56D5|nr:ectoine/hydroxyectoine ABC transporter substrate-binding protein EhuB [Halomonas massiliensis]